MANFSEMSPDMLELAIETDELGIKLGYELIAKLQEGTPTDGLRKVAAGMSTLIESLKGELDDLRRELASRRG